MHASLRVANPFGLLTDPQAVIDAMEKSPRLGALNRRICRPLDRPTPNGQGGEPAAQNEMVKDVDGRDLLIG
ncbi:MAG: hypothetical protein OEU94_13490 [Aquincola sp.]|nr:hypothetical protein [Aquincola sp.]MDH4290569.1 hypothetical protein [Aquincola sp.]